MAIKNFVDAYGNSIEEELCAEPTSHGLMCPEDKLKLEGIEDGANKYVHPTHTAYASGLYKITTNELGHVTSAVPVTKSDITAYGISDNQHTHSQYVDIASEQTITGVKTFKDSYILGRSVFTWDSELNAVVISFEN